MWKVYKEGQGKWARGLVVAVIMIGALLALQQLHDVLPSLRDPQETLPGGPSKWEVVLPLIQWTLDYRYLVHAPLLIGFVILCLWVFNRPDTADFLIETENELKNKVTWPSKREEISASVVVVVMVFILSVFILAADKVFQYLNGLIYGV